MLQQPRHGPGNVLEGVDEEQEAEQRDQRPDNAARDLETAGNQHDGIDEQQRRDRPSRGDTEFLDVIDPPEHAEHHAGDEGDVRDGEAVTLLFSVSLEQIDEDTAGGAEPADHHHAVVEIAEPLLGVVADLVVDPDGDRRAEHGEVHNAEHLVEKNGLFAERTLSVLERQE